MGQKVSPEILRIGYIKNWRSLWYADKGEFARNIVEDYKIRKFIKKRFAQAAVSKIEIERLAERIKIVIHTARPGVIIGRRGADIDRLRNELGKFSEKEISIDPREIKNPNTDAQLIAQNVAFQLEKRIAFRRAMKRAIDNSLNAGVLGIKIRCAGRLNGVEMAREESYHEGKLPLQTFRAQIDYGFAEAFTTYGVLGVKVWINKGEVIRKVKRESVSPTERSKKNLGQNIDAKPAVAKKEPKKDAPKEKADKSEPKAEEKETEEVKAKEE